MAAGHSQGHKGQLGPEWAGAEYRSIVPMSIGHGGGGGVRARN